MEFMLNRRTLRDDARGVGQPLNETNGYNEEGLIVTTRHYLYIAPINATNLNNKQ
jgi:hypothetical protein